MRKRVRICKEKREEKNCNLREMNRILEVTTGTEKWNGRGEATVGNRESEGVMKGDDERERQREAMIPETAEGRKDAAIKTVSEIND